MANNFKSCGLTEKFKKVEAIKKDKEHNDITHITYNYFYNLIWNLFALST